MSDSWSLKGKIFTNTYYNRKHSPWYKQKDISLLRQKLSMDIQSYLHKNLNLGWQKNSDFYLDIQHIINHRFGFDESVDSSQPDGVDE